MLDRRQWVGGAAAALTVAAGSCLRRRSDDNATESEPSAAAEPAPAPVPTAAPPDTMDDALARLERYGHGGGNHAPMGAEALITLGHGAVVARWIESYIRSENMRPRPSGALLGDQWRPALGVQRRIGDWNATFRRAVRDKPWTEVLAHWLPILVPGMSAAATHGVIRTSHAARSLGRKDNQRRRDELADGLAYWAAYYQPIAPLADSETWQPGSAASALGALPAVPAGRRQRRMMPSIARRAGEPTFVRGALAAGPRAGEELAFLGEVTATFAAQFAEYGSRAPIPLTHAVTGASSLRPLWPHIAPAHRGRAVFYAWQTAAALWISFAPGPAATASDESAPATTWDPIVRGVGSAHADVHAIKLAEVCHREAELASANGSFAKAATRAVAIL